MIVVEGPDGSGKTTLIQRLLHPGHGLKLELQERVVSKDAEMMGDLQTWVDEDLSKGFGPRLYDRHRLISEPIYGPVLRTSMQPGFEDVGWLRDRLTRFNGWGPVVIVCLPPLRVVLDNHRRTFDDQPPKMGLREAAMVYWLYVMEAGRRDDALVWDYTTATEQDFNVLVQRIQRSLS